jgi:hypothetical protein
MGSLSKDRSRSFAAIDYDKLGKAQYLERK